jgi:Holliday junction resolvasome RuvABC endonuclease subunit
MPDSITLQNPNARRILALDLGTKTGYAITTNNRLVAGTWTWGTAKLITEWGKSRLTRRSDPRVLNFFSTVRKTILNHNIEQVIFEDVQFASSTFQTQLWASFRAAVWCAASPSTVLVDCVPTGTLKKFATGHGGATKEMMAASLYKFHPGWKNGKLDDNAIDALWLWYWADNHLRLA